VVHPVLVMYLVSSQLVNSHNDHALLLASPLKDARTLLITNTEMVGVVLDHGVEVLFLVSSTMDSVLVLRLWSCFTSLVSTSVEFYSRLLLAQLTC